MPELPEVETISQQLNKTFQNAQIKNVLVRFNGRLQPTDFPKQLTNKTILGVRRRAKIIIFDLSDDLNLVAHLKMTGRMMIEPKNTAPEKHTHLVFEMSGEQDLHWNDVRKFGWLKLMKRNEAQRWLDDHGFGPEPIDDDFDQTAFVNRLRQFPRSTIKPLLMNPKCIVGIGNIYATEALWQARVNPSAKVQNISTIKLNRLYQAVHQILTDAIANHGTSYDRYYLDAQGNRGNYADKLQVYGREKELCARCDTEFKKEKIGGRGTTFCPKCQK